MEWLLLLAEAGSTSGYEGAIGAAAGLLGGGGFSLWYGWYITTKTLPEQAALHREERQADQQSYQESQTALVNKFDATVREQRSEHRADMQVWWAELKEERAARRIDNAQIVEAIRGISSGAK